MGPLNQVDQGSDLNEHRSENQANYGHQFKRKFQQPVDVVIFGDTHEELIRLRDGVLVVNPGSPTYPGRRHPPGSLGTVGLLEVQGATASVSLVKLTGKR